MPRAKIQSFEILARAPRFVGAKLPNTEIITGNWENKFDFNSDGEIDADHERVKRMGEAKAKRWRVQRPQFSPFV